MENLFESAYQDNQDYNQTIELTVTENLFKMFEKHDKPTKNNLNSDSSSFEEPLRNQIEIDS